MNSFIGLVFFHDLCISVMDFSHCIALYFVFCLYDSVLAIILSKATLLFLTFCISKIRGNSSQLFVCVN